MHAVKVLSRDDGDTNIEIAALRRVQGHPNIIGLEGPVEYSSESAFVILEHCDTDLLEIVMASESGLPLEEVRYPLIYSYSAIQRVTRIQLSLQAQRYFAQLVKALRYCHHKGVCHGDLKVRAGFVVALALTISVPFFASPPLTA